MTTAPTVPTSRKTSPRRSAKAAVADETATTGAAKTGAGQIGNAAEPLTDAEGKMSRAKSTMPGKPRSGTPPAEKTKRKTKAGSKADASSATPPRPAAKSRKEAVAPALTLRQPDLRLDLPETAAAVSALNLHGPIELTLAAMPRGTTVTVAPDGVTAGPGGFLRWVARSGETLQAAAILLMARFVRQDGEATSGGILSLLGRDTPGIGFRTVAGVTQIAAGGARLAVPSDAESETLCCALTAAGQLIVVHPDGVVETYETGQSCDLLHLRQILLGQDCAVTLEALEIHLLDPAEAAEAGALLVPLAERFLGSSFPPAAEGPPILIHFGGQSLALGPPVPREDRAMLGALARPRLRRLAGLTAGSPPRPVTLEGPLNQTIHAAGRVTAAYPQVTNRFPPALGMAQALAATGHGRDGPILMIGAPMVGERIEVLDDPAGYARLNCDMLVSHAAEVLGGTTAEVFYLWIQGEADRDLPEGDYAGRLAAHWQNIKVLHRSRFPRAALRMLLMQTGASRHTRSPREPWNAGTDQLDFVTHTQDAEMVGPIYPLRLSDMLHPDLLHSRIMGELAAWAAAETGAGRQWSILAPSATRHDRSVTLTFALRDDEELVAHDRAKYAGIGIDDFLGLEAEGAAITAVRLDGNRLHVGLDGPATEIRYAMQRQDLRGLENDFYAARRGLLRTSLARPAVHIADVTLHRWLPSFRVSLPG